MKGLVKLMAVGLLVTVGGCSSSKLANKNSTGKLNPDLNYWVMVTSDSTLNSMRRNMDSKIRDYNLKQLQDKLDKDRNSPDWGESMYYMLQDLFK